MARVKGVLQFPLALAFLGKVRVFLILFFFPPREQQVAEGIVSGKRPAELQ